MPTIGGHRPPAPAPWTSAQPKSARSATVELNQRIVVFAGHGSYASVTDAGQKEFFNVPVGVRIVFWCQHGHAFAGSELDTRMHTNDFAATKFDWDINHGALVGVAPGLPEVYGPGAQCRNYRLTPPTGLTLGNNPAKDRKFITMSDRGPQNIGYRLSDLLQTHWDVCRNATVHWAACRSVIPR